MGKRQKGSGNSIEPIDVDLCVPRTDCFGKTSLLTLLNSYLFVGFAVITYLLCILSLKRHVPSVLSVVVTGLHL